MKNEKIENLVSALKATGVDCFAKYNNEWRCMDGKSHYGIAIYTNIPADGRWGGRWIYMCFMPDGTFIKDPMAAPTEEMEE